MPRLLPLTGPAAVLALAAAVLAGCASNGVRFSERVTDPATGQVTETEFVQRARVTWGSTLEEGTGSMNYAAADWSLAVGNAASQAQAGNGADLLRALVSLGQILAPALPAAPPAPAASEAAPSMTHLVEMVFEALGGYQQPRP